jgi:branched-subunit amino acid ABC-type transport system permease component
MNAYSQAIVSGVLSGTVYAMLAVGLVVVYRTSRVLNLAHGESFAAAGVTTAMLVQVGVPLWLAMLSGILVAVCLSVAVYELILRPRFDWPLSGLILATLGAAFLVRGVLIAVVGPDPVSFRPVVAGPPIRMLGGAIPIQGIALLLIGLIASFAVAALIRFTMLGKSLQATAENPATAQLLGINVRWTNRAAFIFSGILCALAAELLVPLFSVDYQSGLAMTLRGFIAAAISGMSPVGAIFAGLFLGIAESLIASSIGALFQDPLIFAILVLIALWQSRNIRFGGVRRA